MLKMINVALDDQEQFYTIEIKKDKIESIMAQSGRIQFSSDYNKLEDMKGKHLDSLDKDICCDVEGQLLVPAAIDCHIHSRDPGFPINEDWKSLAKAAFKGGVVAVADMPNTNPATLTLENVIEKSERASASGLEYKLFLGVSQSNLKEIPALLDHPELPLAGLKVYYGRSTGNLLFDNLEALADVVKGTNKTIVFHCEQQDIIDHNMKVYAKDIDSLANFSDFSVHSKIRSSKAAYEATAKVISWACQHGLKVHIAHVSTANELELISQAQEQGFQITSEVAPHHLLFTTNDYKLLGPFIKVNPPIRSEAEVSALRNSLFTAKIDCIASDHAPHNKIEKISPYNSSPSGLPSIEFYWPLVYKIFCMAQKMNFADLVNMTAKNPANIFSYEGFSGIKVGNFANFVCLEKKPHTVRESQLLAKCRWSPYTGSNFQVQVKSTWLKGENVFWSE